MPCSRFSYVSFHLNELAIVFEILDHRLVSIDDSPIDLPINVLGVNHIFVQVVLHLALMLLVEGESGGAPLLDNFVFDDGTETFFQGIKLNLELGVNSELFANSPALTLFEVHRPIFLL